MFNWKRSQTVDGPVVLDEAYLERLARHLGEENLRELLADGMVELCDRIDRIEDSLNSGDADALARLCHDLAGMSGHLGLSELSRNAVSCERALREPDSDIRGLGVMEPILTSSPAAIQAMRYFLDGASAD